MDYSNNDLINQKLIDNYFERSFTPHEEQDFLVSLASNDKLRELFRAEVLLLQATAEQHSQMHLSEEYTAEFLAKLPFQPAPPPHQKKRALTFLLLGLTCIGAGFGIDEWRHGNDGNRSTILQPAVSKEKKENGGEISVQVQNKKITSVRKNIAPTKKEKKSSVVELPPMKSSATEKQSTTSLKEQAEKDKPFEIRFKDLTGKDSTRHTPQP